MSNLTLKGVRKWPDTTKATRIHKNIILRETPKSYQWIWTEERCPRNVPTHLRFLIYYKKRGELALYLNSSPIRRVLNKVTPFYAWKYGDKVRLCIWMSSPSNILQQHLSLFTTEWQELFNNKEQQWVGPCGRWVVRDPKRYVSFKNGGIPYRNIKLYNPRPPSKKYIPKKPRSNLTFYELVKTFPLLSNIAIMLQNHNLKKVCEAHQKWDYTLGEYHWYFPLWMDGGGSIQNAVDILYPQVKIVHPTVTKCRLYTLVKQVWYSLSPEVKMKGHEKWILRFLKKYPSLKKE